MHCIQCCLVYYCDEATSVALWQPVDSLPADAGLTESLVVLRRHPAKVAPLFPRWSLQAGMSSGQSVLKRAGLAWSHKIVGHCLPEMEPGQDF